MVLEAAAEGMSIYRFNRGGGDQREIVTFRGDPLDPHNKQADGTPVPEYLASRELAGLHRGPAGGRGQQTNPTQAPATANAAIDSAASIPRQLERAGAAGIVSAAAKASALG